MKLKLTRSKSNKQKFITVSNTKNKFEFVCDPDHGVTVGKKVLDVEIIEEEGFTYIKHKNKKYPIEVSEKNQNKVQVVINGVTYQFTIETPISYKRSKFLEKNKKSSKIEIITAPMPGKILEVLAEENQSVKINEAILILEAMKMQNEILSTISGKVIKIHVKPNDVVNKDDLLVEIEK